MCEAGERSRTKNPRFALLSMDVEKPAWAYFKFVEQMVAAGWVAQFVILESGGPDDPAGARLRERMATIGYESIGPHFRYDDVFVFTGDADTLAGAGSESLITEPVKC